MAPTACQHAQQTCTHVHRQRAQLMPTASGTCMTTLWVCFNVRALQGRYTVAPNPTSCWQCCFVLGAPFPNGRDAVGAGHMEGACVRRQLNAVLKCIAFLILLCALLLLLRMLGRLWEIGGLLGGHGSRWDGGAVHGGGAGNACACRAEEQCI